MVHHARLLRPWKPGPQERRTVYSMVDFASGPWRTEVLGARRIRRGEFGLPPRKNVNKMMQQVQRCRRKCRRPRRSFPRDRHGARAVARSGDDHREPGACGAGDRPAVVDPEDIEMLQDMVPRPQRGPDFVPGDPREARRITGGLGDLGLNMPGL